MKRISIVFMCAFTLFQSCKHTTEPDQLINNKASLPASFKLSELHQKVITSFINKNDRTTSILYGNEKAWLAANTGRQSETPGESFTLVTWRQQDDPHWFGARIPGDLLSAETLTFTGQNTAPAYDYQKFSGKELAKVADTTGRTARITFILSQKTSVVPLH